MSDLEQEVETFKIPEWNIPKLEKKIASLNKRAAKIGSDPINIITVGITSEIHPEFRQKVQILGIENVPHINVHEIIIDGKGPKIEGYKFVGTLDHKTLPGHVMVNTVPGETVPQEYFNRDTTCDHCGKKRVRKETFVLEDETGSYSVVGRSCVRDFIGYDPTSIASYLTSLYKLVGSLEEEEYQGGGSTEYFQYDPEMILRISASAIKRYGWTPKGMANEDRPSTVSNVFHYLTPPFDAKEVPAWKEWKKEMDIDNEEFVKEAADARDWLETQTANNEYMHNIKGIATQKTIPAKVFGYWSSLISAFQRDQDRLKMIKIEKETKLNEHFGKVKERLEMTLKVNKIRRTEGYYGVTDITNMVDELGRTVVWFNNGSTELEEGETYKVKATIKKHDEFRDWKQTVVTRLALV